MISSEIASTKRKAKDAFVPDSFASYLMGALRGNFEHLSNHIQHDCAFVRANPNSKQYTKQLLEELFRYLYLLADSSSDGVIRSSPSYFVDQAFHCLMLDPVLYWKICNELLNMLGKDKSSVEIRVLPHDALGGTGDNEKPRQIRYTNTLIQYKQTFGEDPPLALWSDYSNDPVAVQAELSAQEAQAATVHRPHLVPAGSAFSRSTSSVATPPKDEPNLKSKIKLTFSGMNENCLAMTVRLGEKFETVLGRVRAHQRQSIKFVEFMYRGMVMRKYMTPYNLNMKDGDVVNCSFSIYSPEELSAQAPNTDQLNSSLNEAALDRPVLASFSISATTDTTTTTTATTSTAATTAFAAKTDTLNTAATTDTIGSIDTTPGTTGSVTSSQTMLPLTLADLAAAMSSADTAEDRTTSAKLVSSDLSAANGVAYSVAAACASSISDPSTSVETISICLNNVAGEKMFYKIAKTLPIGGLFDTYAVRRGIKASQLKFTIYGRVVSPWMTPKMLELKDGTTINVM